MPSLESKPSACYPILVSLVIDAVWYPSGATAPSKSQLRLSTSSWEQPVLAWQNMPLRAGLTMKRKHLNTWWERHTTDKNIFHFPIHDSPWMLCCSFPVVFHQLIVSYVKNLSAISSFSFNFNFNFTHWCIGVSPLNVCFHLSMD